MLVYTVYDSVAKDSCPPFLAVNDGVALRQYRELLSKTRSPQDYLLYLIGEYIPASMILRVVDEPVIVNPEDK